MKEDHPVKQGDRGRLGFWLAVGLAVAVYIFGLHTYQRMAQARQTVDILQPVIGKDFRLGKVRIARISTSSVLVSGEVRSYRDLGSLKDLIRGNTTPDGIPLHPLISVEVSSIPK
jgi:hypothetical protein